MFKEDARLDQYIRFAAPQNVINMGRDYSNRATFGAKTKKRQGSKVEAAQRRPTLFGDVSLFNKYFFNEQWKATRASSNPYAGAFNFRTRYWEADPTHPAHAKKRRNQIRMTHSACRNAFLTFKLRIPHFLTALTEKT